MHSNTELPPPWHGRTPLLTHIWDWDGRGLMVLPDEDTLPPDLLRHQPGERDARWVRPNAQHPSSALEEEGLDIVESVYFMLRRLIHTDSDFARVALYAMVLDRPVITYADRLVERLSRLEAQMLLPHARWLVREAVHREPLKLGMLLLGLSGRPEDLVDIRALARHDELSLFGVMAAELLCDDPTDVWWEMAHKAHGWGRIVTIERLADMVYDRPDIQTWLVRHGCRNNIGPEHLAWTCATAGALADVLNCSLVDRAT
ncbi:MAG: hypothetical protein AAFX99_34525, partial [Myxococcota bacterium]